MTPTPARLQGTDLRLGYGESIIVDGLDIEILDGTVTAVIGPNGCGKSTLLRALGRLLPTTRGHVLLDGERIDRMPTRQVAKVLGVLPQARPPPKGSPSPTSSPAAATRTRPGTGSGRRTTSRPWRRR